MVYRLSIASRVTFGLLAVGALAAGAYLIMIHSEPGMPTLIRQLLGLLLVAGGAWGLAAIFRYRITIDDKALTLTWVFSSKTIDLDDIDGYRAGTKGEFFLVRKDGGRSIVIPSGIEEREELIGWFKQRYKDVDKLEHNRRLKALLNDEDMGVTKQERAARLKKANRQSVISFLVSLVLLFWVVFYPRPMGLIMFLVLAAPVVGVLITAQAAGMILFSTSKLSPNPSLVWSMLMPIGGAAFEVLRRYNIYSYPRNVWWFLAAGALTITLIVALLCHRAMAGEKDKFSVLFCLFAGAAIYCWALMVYVNCHYDGATPVVSRVGVRGKRTRRGKSTTYYLRLSSWGRYESGEEMKVSGSFYESVADGDSIRINMQSGRFGVPWYWLEK